MGLHGCMILATCTDSLIVLFSVCSIEKDRKILRGGGWGGGGSEGSSVQPPILLHF